MATITDLGAYAERMIPAPKTTTVAAEPKETAGEAWGKPAPRLDEWEYNLTIAALRQYFKYEMMLLRTDTPRERKRKLFNREKIKSAIHKMRRQ